MPRGAHFIGKGKTPGSGRKKGVPDKAKVEFESAKQVLERMGLNPIERLAKMADGDVPCGVCMGTGKTRWQPKKRKALEGMELDEEPFDSTKERTCQSCYGSGFERISPADRSRAASELAKYVQPQLKAIEISGNADRPIVTEIRIEFIEASEGRPA